MVTMPACVSNWVAILLASGFGVVTVYSMLWFGSKVAN